MLFLLRYLADGLQCRHTVCWSTITRRKRWQNSCIRNGSPTADLPPLHRTSYYTWGRWVVHFRTSTLPRSQRIKIALEQPILGWLIRGSEMQLTKNISLWIGSSRVVRNYTHIDHGSLWALWFYIWLWLLDGEDILNECIFRFSGFFSALLPTEEKV